MKRGVKNFDVIVIGAGSGLTISSEAADSGLKVAVIDEGPFGGTCLNRGCIPSKMLIHHAYVAETIQHADKFGIKAKMTGVNWKQIVNHVSRNIDGHAREILAGNREHPKITVYTKHAKFIGKKLLQVGNKVITAKKIFICAGARPFIPPINGIQDVPYITSKEALRLQKQPKSLVIIGGGYIAAELAAFFGPLGTKVTIIQRAPTMVTAEDGEVKAKFTKIFSRKHTVVLNATAKEVSKKGKQIVVKADVKGKIKTFTGDALLIATGRVPNSDLLEVKKTGVKTNKRGFIKVNSYMETGVPGIWAIGDICGIFMFKHSANLEAEYAIYNALNPRNKARVNYLAMPHAVFSGPQIAGVGMTEEQVKAKKIHYLIGKYNYWDTAMGQAMHVKKGFVKVLAHAKTRKILGCHIIGPEASTLIHEVIVAMRAGLTINGVIQAVHIHPALSEVVQKAFASVQ